jgi:hypothetical protein
MRCTKIVDLRAAAVHDHGIHPDQLEQHDVARERLFQLLVGHGVAAVLDDDRPAVETLDVRQRVGQDAGLECAFYGRWLGRIGHAAVLGK